MMRPENEEAALSCSLSYDKAIPSFDYATAKA